MRIALQVEVEIELYPGVRMRDIEHKMNLISIVFTDLWEPEIDGRPIGKIVGYTTDGAWKKVKE